MPSIEEQLLLEACAVRRIALLAAVVPTISRADSTTPSCADNTLPTFVVEIGPMTRRILEPASSGTTSYRGVTDDPHAQATAGMLRLGVASGHFYGGGEIDVGSLLESYAGATTIDDMGREVVDETKLTVLTQYTGFAGMRTTLGLLVVSGELHGGGRTLDYNTRHRADGSIVSVTTLVVEPRLRVQWFARPRLAIGMAVATSAIHQGELGIGIDLALHTRPFRAQ